MKAQFVTLFLLVAALNTPTKATTPCPNSGSQASILPASTSIIIYPTPSSSISPQSSSAAVAAQSSSLPIPTTQSPIVYSTPASTQSSSASVAAQSSSLPASTSQSTIVYPIPSSSTSSAQSSSASVAAQSSSVPAPTSTSIPYLAPSISSSSSVAPVLTSSTPIYVLPSPTISPSVLPTSSIAPTTTSTTPAPYVIPTPTPFTCTSAAASPANATTFSKTTFTSASCQRLCDPISGATCTYANNVCTCKSLDKSRRYDPLIFDLNKDSFVTAVTGSGGIDLNEDNIGDASVAEGDGMLALYSHDPSQHDVAINITGVFGTDTYNPFVKRVMKTPNGFEALFTLAIWAQVDNPAKKIIDNENVYMNALDDALKTVNYGIGFFVKTGANTKKDIVSLGDVSIVRVSLFSFLPRFNLKFRKI